MAFGENLERLDEVLRRLESDPMPLDEALDAFEQGISPSPISVQKDKTVTFTANPDSGYKVKEWKADGIAVQIGRAHV